MCVVDYCNLNTKSVFNFSYAFSIVCVALCWWLWQFSAFTCNIFCKHRIIRLMGNSRYFHYKKKACKSFRFGDFIRNSTRSCAPKKVNKSFIILYIIKRLVESDSSYQHANQSLESAFSFSNNWGFWKKSISVSRLLIGNKSNLVASKSLSGFRQMIYRDFVSFVISQVHKYTSSLIHNL